MYDYLVELGWKNIGLRGGFNQFRRFEKTSFWGAEFVLDVDLQYAAEGTWVIIYQTPKYPEITETLIQRFSGVIFSNEEIPVLMRQVQIAE